MVERFKQLNEEEQEEFKSELMSFRSLYAFLSQIIPYQDSDLEKLYTFGLYLLRKLPRRDSSTQVVVDDEVQLEYYRLQKISEGTIDLNAGDPPVLGGPSAVGTGRPDDDVLLSTLVEQLNEQFGTEFGPADQLFFEQLRATAAADEHLRQAAAVNSLENFAPVFIKQLESLFIERMEGNEDIYLRVMNDTAFKEFITAYLVRSVYAQIRDGHESDA